MKNYKLSTSTWDDKEINAIQKVIDTGFYSMGEYVQQFESMFSKYIGAKYTVMVNSGSSANLLGIASLFFTKNNKLKRGDEVIVPAVSWSTTYSPLQQYGLKLKFVDIDINTLNYNLEELESAISDKTRLILAVNLLGNSNDFERIYKIINNRDIILFEDNCESLGAEFKNKKAGTFGKLGTFSSFFSHHISTMEGGMIVTDDEEIYNILLSIRAHGWTRNLPDKNIIHNKSKNDFNEKFKFILPGYNVRPLEMSGAIGLEQLKKLPGFVSNRVRNAKYFMDKFSDNNDFIFQREIGKSSWFGFSIIIKNNLKFERTSLLRKLNKAHIETRPIVTGNFINNPTISYYKYEIHNSLHNADFLDINGFFVGNHHYSMKDEIDYLYKVIYNT